MKFSSGSQKSHRPGFTLIEVLITTVLTSVLLWGMWGVIGTFLDLFNRGEQIAELSQLVRGLTQQLEADLKGVVPTISSAEGSSKKTSTSKSSINKDEGSGSTKSEPSFLQNRIKSSQKFNSSSSSSLMQFGLVGSARTLRLDMIQLVPVKEVEEENLELSDVDEEKYQPKVPELRTVLYTFEKGHEWSPQDNVPRSGFIRRDLSWEEYLIMRSSSSGESNEESEKFKGQDLVYDKNWPGDDESIIWVPVIYNLKFRYFNGDLWLSKWDSYGSGKLPVAVEIVFAMESITDRKLREKNYQLDENDKDLLDDDDEEDDLEPVELDTLAGDDVEADTLEAGSRPLFRQVIYLPMGNHKIVQSKEKSSEKETVPSSLKELP